MRRRHMMMAAAIVGLSMSQTVSAQRGLGRIKIDQPFPELTFRSMDDGRPVSMADFRGKKVVLHIFASW